MRISISCGPFTEKNTVEIEKQQSHLRRAKQCRPHAVRRRATVTRASRSRARLISATNRRDSWRSHVHRTRFRRPRSSSSADLPMCGVEGQDPSSFLSGVQGGYSLSRKRVSPFIRAALSAALPAAPVPQLPLHLCEKEKKGNKKPPPGEARASCCVVCVFLGGRKAQREEFPFASIKIPVNLG